MDSANANAGTLQQITYTARSKPKKIVGPLMFFPHVRNDEMHHSSGFENTPELLNDSARLRRVLQNNNRYDVIERLIRKRQFRETTDDVKFRVIPRRVSRSITSYRLLF